MCEWVERIPADFWTMAFANSLFLSDWSKAARDRWTKKVGIPDGFAP
jgi:hypothetical protein